jgi:hypothetical protein
MRTSKARALGAAKVVQPETILRWHRSGFKAFWRWKSRKRAGRPKIDRGLRDLIQPAVGRVPDPWRTPDAWLRGRPVDGLQIHGAGWDFAFARLESRPSILHGAPYTGLTERPWKLTEPFRNRRDRNNSQFSSVANYHYRFRKPVVGQFDCGGCLPSQGWKIFLRNHADGIASMDLFVVPISATSKLAH